MGVSGNSDSVRGESLDAAFERFVAESAPTLPEPVKSIETLVDRI